MVGKHAAPARRQCRAFTLVEILLVVAIIGTVTAMAVPRYTRAVAEYRASAAARRVAADLMLARARAAATSSSQTIAFAPDANLPAGCYQIVGMSDPDHPSAIYTVDLSAHPYRASLSSATFGAGSTLVFNGYGIPASGGAVVVQAGTARRTMVVDAATGTVSWQ